MKQTQRLFHHNPFRKLIIFSGPYSGSTNPYFEILDDVFSNVKPIRLTEVRKFSVEPAKNTAIALWLFSE